MNLLVAMFVCVCPSLRTVLGHGKEASSTALTRDRHRSDISSSSGCPRLLPYLDGLDPCYTCLLQLHTDHISQNTAVKRRQANTYQHARNDDSCNHNSLPPVKLCINTVLLHMWRSRVNTLAIKDVVCQQHPAAADEVLHCDAHL